MPARQRPCRRGRRRARASPSATSKGLHARASAKFVQTVEKFDAEVRVTRCGETVGGTSIMGLMMLGGVARHHDHRRGDRQGSGRGHRGLGGAHRLALRRRRLTGADTGGRGDDTMTSADTDTPSRNRRGRGQCATAARQRSAILIAPMSTETFADSITGLSSTARRCGSNSRSRASMTSKHNTPITGRRYPACRLVLPPAAAVDLINRMQQIANGADASRRRQGRAAFGLANAGYADIRGCCLCGSRVSASDRAQRRKSAAVAVCRSATKFR